ncbi:MAG: hypothetical protein OXN89_17525 [Bryobacterales bacterium]|nr:hypothetical protein [Bryobacterales bacterium]
MKAERESKPFDCLKWVSENRSQIHGETKDMSWEEREQWILAQVMGPSLAELYLTRRRLDGRSGPVDTVGG